MLAARGALDRDLDAELEIVGAENFAERTGAKRTVAHEAALRIDLGAGRGQVRYALRPGVIHHQPRAHLVRIPGQPARERTAQRRAQGARGFVSSIERVERLRVEQPRAHLARREIVVGMVRDDVGKPRGGLLRLAACERQFCLDLGDLDALERIVAVGRVSPRLIERGAGGGKVARLECNAHGFELSKHE